MLRRWFLDHPHAVDESYAEHGAVAAGYGLALIGAGLACMVHALVPALFETTASRTVRRLVSRLGARRTQASPQDCTPAATA